MEIFYWDSNCFLKLFKGDEEGAETLYSYIEKAETKKLKILTSALTIAEVLKMKNEIPIPRRDRDKVANFFNHEYIIIRDVTRRTSILARDLVWDSSIDPKDALHVATAIQNNIFNFHTYDEKLIKKSGIIMGKNITISRPPTITAPFQQKDIFSQDKPLVLEEAD